MDKPGVLFVGNLLESVVGARAVSTDVAMLLSERGWPVLTTSSRVSKVSRLADMLATIWRCRHAYQVAHVDVFERFAFLWACASCLLLSQLGKPYVLTLRGG